MNMYKTTHRILTALVAFFAMAFAASAQNVKLSLGNLVLTPGKTTVVSLDLENDKPVGAVVTADIFLPEGVKARFVEKDGRYVQRGSRINEFAEVAASTKDENKKLASNQLRVIILDLDNEIEAGRGPVLTFEVETDDDAEIPLNAVATIKDANVGGIKVADTTCPLVDGSFEGVIAANDIELTPTKEAAITLNMTNNLPVAMFQTNIALPEGLSFVENEGVVFTPANRIASTHKVNATVEGNRAVVMIQPQSLVNPLNMLGSAGPLFTFNVKADATLAAEGNITFSQVIGASLEARTFNFEPITIKVSNPDVEANAAADAAVKALEEKLTATQTALSAYAEDIQTALAEQKAAAEQKVADVKEAAQTSKDNGTAAADLAALQTAITEAEGLCDALLQDAETLKAEAEAQKEAAEANKAQNEKDNAAVAAAEQALADALAAMAEYDESVVAAVAEAKAAAEAAIQTAKDAVAASFEAGTAVADAEANAALVTAAREAIATLAADAKAAQDKFIAEKEAEEANKAQNEKDNAAVAAAEQALADALAAMAEYDESVVAAVAEAKAAAEAAIQTAKDAVAASFEAGTAVADAEANAALVTAAREAIATLAADAKAAQDKFIADKEAEEAKVAEAEKYAANVAALEALEADLKAAKAAAKEAGYDCTEEVEDINKLIDRLSSKIEIVHSNNTSVAAAEEVDAAIANIAAKIKALQDAADAKAAEVAANEAQYTADLALVADAQAKVDELKATVAGYKASVQEAVAGRIAEVETALATALEAIEASHTAMTSVADAEANALTVTAAVAQVPAIAETAANLNESAEIPAGDYLIKNVATGKYLGGANSWGTQASLVEDGRIFTVARLEDGTYTLDSHTYNSDTQHFLGHGGYVDANVAPFMLFEVEGGVAIAIAKDNAYAAPAEGTVVVSGVAYQDVNAAWEFIPVADLVSALETSEGDATFLIKDASISRNLYSKENVWEGDAIAKGGPNENQNAEKWGGNSQEFDIYQTVNVPNGSYVLTVQGYYRYNNTTDNTNNVAVEAHAQGTEEINSFFYANDVEVALKSIADDEATAALAAVEKGLPFSQGEASEAFAMGLYLNTLRVDVTDGVLKLGVKKTSHPGCDWTVWDNFTLTKVVPDAIEDVTADVLNVSRKVVENNKVVIYRNGRKYSVTGAVLK